MRTRALTASEAIARLISLGYKMNAHTTIKENEYTLRFGKAENGIYYTILMGEYGVGMSNIMLYRFVPKRSQPNTALGFPVISYHNMQESEKEEFLQMLESAEIM